MCGFRLLAPTIENHRPELHVVLEDEQADYGSSEEGGEHNGFEVGELEGFVLFDLALALDRHAPFESRIMILMYSILCLKLRLLTSYLHFSKVL